MKKSVQGYARQVDKIIDNKSGKENLPVVAQNHLTKIGFYQHERFIHLIVTALFAIISMMVFLYSINNFSIGIFILLILLLLILASYVGHYYFLENNVQYMYKQYDRIKDRIDK